MTVDCVGILYLDGKIELFRLRDGNAGVIFLMPISPLASSAADTLRALKPRCFPLEFRP
jgi:hypothetical protein